MKFDCGETFAEKKRRLKQWHRWFAWRPVKVNDHDCRWLEWVERRGDYYPGYADNDWEWEHRPAPERYKK